MINLVDHIFKTIQESARQILYHKYKQLLPYQDTNHFKYSIAESTTTQCEIKQYKPHPGSYKVQVKNLYEENEIFFATRNWMGLDLYIMQIEDNPKLKIEFMAGVETRKEDLKRVGIPLYVYKKEGDTLNDIITNAMGNRRKYIQSVYRIHSRKEEIISNMMENVDELEFAHTHNYKDMIHIKEDQYDEYEPYKEFEAEDSLLIVVKDDLRINVNLYQYHDEERRKEENIKNPYYRESVY